MDAALSAKLAEVVASLFGSDVSIELVRPDEQFGDYSTNVALRLAKTLNKKPHEIASQLADAIRLAFQEEVSQVEIAGPGFINIRLHDSFLLTAATTAAAYRSQVYVDKVVVTEYSDPNPFKVLHAGHLYTSIVGNAIANILESAGGQVHRVNFGGDVGLHVAKTMWAILEELGGENPEKLSEVPESDRPEWLTRNYILGTNAYEESEEAKRHIITLNKQVYQIVNDQDNVSAMAQIYWTCRQWSYDYFNAFYEQIGVAFEKYYPESEMAPIGLAVVREHLDSVYEYSNGAVIFDAEKYGLHTRVFINSEGLPTYEAKDVGLIMKKWQDYHFDSSVIITGNDIIEYMKVVLKSIEQFEPELARATTHLTHGMVKLKGGEKMSSRKGNILRAEAVLEAAATANRQLTGHDQPEITLGAVKYTFLKNRMGGDIVFDPVESVSIAGNSGPYLQYAYSRARSILRKANADSGKTGNDTLELAERSLVRKISEYAAVIDKATLELMPHHICTYLYELAQNFNSFYEHNRVIGDPRQNLRLLLVQMYADVLEAGLGLLGVPAPQHM